MKDPSAKNEQRIMLLSSHKKDSRSHINRRKLYSYNPLCWKWIGIEDIYIGALAILGR